MWSTSLATHQKTFSNLAQQISNWDRMLVENMGKITGLYGRCFQAERDVSEVERQLSAVEHGQVEMEQVLERYEAWVDEMVEGSEGYGGEVDGERERTYVFHALSYACVTDDFANDVLAKQVQIRRILLRPPHRYESQPHLHDRGNQRCEH